MPDLHTTAGYRYLKETKFDRASLHSVARPHINAGPRCKEYPEAVIMPLPHPAFPDQADRTLWTLLQQRRSYRRYSSAALPAEDLALLLWAAQGVTAQAGPHLLRTAPSAGALYPVETYVAVANVNGIPPGLYHFNVRGFHLEQLTSQSVTSRIARGALDQAFIKQASLTIIWSAVLRRNMCKYGHRGLRYILLDAGHICQNLLLAVEAVGLAACPVAAFFDDELNAVLDLDGEEESVIYLASVGANAVA